MSVHLNLRNGKIRTDDKEDIVQTAAPAAQETAAQTSADYERQVRLNLKKGTVSYGGKSYGLSHEGTSNAGSQALQERIDARSREQKARTGNIWQAQSQTANRQSTEARQEETARQKVITMLAAGAAGLGSRSTGSARGTASSYLQGGGSTGGSAYAAALSAPAGRTQRYVSGREQLGQDILNLNRRQDAEQALGSRVMSDTARTDTLEQAARDTVIDAMVRQAQAGGQTQADKARAFDQVNAWLDENPEAKTLWDAERGAGRGNPAAQRAAQRIRAGMSEEEERAYEQAGELYDSYGSAWSAAHRLGSDVKGLAQQAAGSWATLAESIAPATRDEAANNSAERHALAELRRLTDEGKVFETDENGQIRTSDEYEAALARYNAAKEAGPQDNQKTVLTDENSAGMRLYHEGGENLAKAQAGLGSAARFGADTANAIAGNLPNMALALIPGVGPAVSLGALGAQAAGGRMAELYDEDTGADEALWRGLVSGGIEVGTEVLPVGSWVEIVNRGGKGLVRNLLQQMGEEGTEEAVGYVVNYLADVAAKDPNAEFSWAELAQNAGMGAISGGVYGAAGTGLNLALNRANTRMAENLAGGENQVQQANTRTAQAVREAALTQAQDMQQAVADPLGAAARLEEETRPGSTAAEEKYAPQAAQSAQESAQNADGELAARQAENAAQAAADALAQEKAAQDADTLTGEEAAQRADAQAVSEAALAQAAAERYAQESAPQADTVALERGTVRRETVEGIQAFADAEESYTPYMKKALVERYKGQSPAVYVQEMHSMYNAGREGVLSFEQAKSASAARAAVVQDDAALYTAYSLGRNAASALTVKQPAAAVTEPEVRYDGVPAGSAQVPDAVLQGVAENVLQHADHRALGGKVWHECGRGTPADRRQRRGGERVLGRRCGSPDRGRKQRQRLPDGAARADPLDGGREPGGLGQAARADDGVCGKRIRAGRRAAAHWPVREQLRRQDAGGGRVCPRPVCRHYEQRGEHPRVCGICERGQRNDAGGEAQRFAGFARDAGQDRGQHPQPFARRRRDAGRRRRAAACRARRERRESARRVRRGPGRAGNRAPERPRAPGGRRTGGQRYKKRPRGKRGREAEQKRTEREERLPRGQILPPTGGAVAEPETRQPREGGHGAGGQRAEPGGICGGGRVL